MVRLVEITQPVVDKLKIEQILLQYFEVKDNTYSVDDGGLVSVEGYCILKEKCHHLPVLFKSTGDFNVYRKGLTSLKGCPMLCYAFSCGGNQLTTLAGGPLVVEGDFIAYDNPLETLEGLPKTITGIIWLPDLPNLPLLRLVGRHNHFIFKANGDYNYQLTNIFRKYNGEASRSNILKCQKDLMDAGYVGNAAW